MAELLSNKKLRNLNKYEKNDNYEVTTATPTQIISVAARPMKNDYSIFKI